MSVEREGDKRADMEEAVASESVAEGATMEVIFLLRCEIMAMNPRDSKHRQHIILVRMEEEGMPLAV